VYSDADAGARHVRIAEEAIHLPGVAPADTYLNAERLIEGARRIGADAIHPGYGFLSESADFAQAVIDAGLAWVGPPPRAIRAVGDKISARRLAESAGVPVVEGITDAIDDAAIIEDFVSAVGLPVAIKASGGGGGRGLKVVREASEIPGAFEAAQREAAAYFDSRDVYVERYLDAPKHLEVQIIAPHPDEALWLGVRDCSLQRRHQKLVEETPPALFAEQSSEMGHSAVALSKASGYVNAGTCEFLVDGDGNYYFLEVNSRLQVEHTVTEQVVGLDLVACQLQVAAGDALGFKQQDVDDHLRGHAIECRINAEDPARSFLPDPAPIRRYIEPGGLGVRVDSGYAEGDVVPDAYDSLIAKLVTWGNDREEARMRMLRALREFEIEGPSTTIAAHIGLLESEEFRAGTYTTRTVEAGLLDDLVSPEIGAETDTGVLLLAGRAVRLWHESMSAAASASVSGGVSAADLGAPMQGTIVSVLVAQGDEVAAGDPLFVLEAMKMETTIAAPRSGVVANLEVSEGAIVQSGQVLARID
jgi:acetyl-CoA/propionyl-CoA carboxylase biotin carboxyl carrier protein